MADAVLTIFFNLQIVDTTKQVPQLLSEAGSEKMVQTKSRGVGRGIPLRLGDPGSLRKFIKSVKRCSLKPFETLKFSEGLSAKFGASWE